MDSDIQKLARPFHLSAAVPDENPKSASTASAARLPTRIDYTETETIDVPSETLQNNRIIAAMDPNPFTNSYKIMRSQVLQRMRENGWKSLALTSPGRNEGKTLTAVNLSVSLAMEINHTVLLVDANLRNPEVASMFGIEAEKGLTDHLVHGVPIETLLINPAGIDRLVILPGGAPVFNAGELLASPMMNEFAAEVKSRYPNRIIVFDLPPVLIAGEALAIAPCIDATLLVVEAGRTRKDDIIRCRELLAPANLIGTVLNRSKETTRHR